MMNGKDRNKTKRQLIEELALSHQQIAELEDSASRQRQIENSLHAIEERTQVYFSFSDDILFSYDNQLKVLSVSPNVERITGYKPDELVGKYFYDLKMIVPPDDVDEVIDNAQHMLSGKTAYPNIYRFITKDGSVRYAETSGVPIMKDGKVVAMVSVARDITKRIEMENSLQASEERLRVTLHSMPLAVSISRIKDARYLYVNEGFCNITGYSQEETIGKTPFELGLPGTPESIDQCMKLITKNEFVDSLVYQCRNKDGMIIETLLYARPVKYGGEDCMIMVMRDVTAERQIEEERKRLDLQFKKMESIATLAGGIAHDFNNILTSIIGYTQMSMKDILALARGDKDLSVVRGDLNEVRNAALRARDLVNQILAFSRHREKEYEQIDLGITVKESLMMLRPTLPANIKIREDLSAPGLILGDPGQIHQLLMNLCTNAAHAMEDTGGELMVCIVKVDVRDDAADNLYVPPGPYLRLTIRDTGHGMTQRVMARIFDPYFTTKWKGHGTGLGLSVVHGIVKAHGGAIDCRSEPGEGATFDVYFPEIESKDKALSAFDSTADTAGKERILNLDEERPHNEERKSREGSRKLKIPKDRNKLY